MATAKIELITSAKRENCLHRGYCFGNSLEKVFIFAIDKKELRHVSAKPESTRWVSRWTLKTLIYKIK